MTQQKNPEFHFSVQAPQRLDVFLSAQLAESRSFIQTQIEEGRVQVNEKTCSKAGTRLKAGDRITGHVQEPPPLEATPIPGPLEILFEDDALVVVNKAPGVVVHPGAGTHGATLVHHLLYHLGETFKALSPIRPGIVHRLDRGTTGVLVVAKTRKALEHLGGQFKDRTVNKTYQAVAWGKLPPKGRWTSAVGRDRKDRKKMSSRTDVPRSAQTQYRTLGLGQGLSWVELSPKTGRTHQLRVHLSEAGFPIVGDELYGGLASPARIRDLASELGQELRRLDHTLLHACRLELDHPVTAERLSFEAPLPPDFARVVERLGFEETDQKKT